MNIPAAFLDVRHEYEELIHQRLRAVPRYSAGVNVSTAHNKIELIRHALDTAEEVLSFFEKHAIQAVSFHVHDSLRHAYEHPSISERRYSRDDMSAWLNEATVTSAAMHLWRSGVKDAPQKGTVKEQNLQATVPDITSPRGSKPEDFAGYKPEYVDADCGTLTDES